MKLNPVLVGIKNIIWLLHHYTINSYAYVE